MTPSNRAGFPGVPRARRLAALDAALPLLACPVCRGGLHRTEASLVCPAGHRFDLARDGHVNLLGRATPAHADTPAMVAARQSFLSTGAYRPIADAIIEVLTSRDASTDVQPRTVAEFGAGPGYYLSCVLAALPPGAVGLATDISPAAARAAAAGGLASVVADSWARLPVRSGSLDAVLCVFAPRQPAELARVLAPDGRLILVTPTPEHLREARERLGLLGVDPRAGERARTALAAAGFQVARPRRLAYPLTLTADGLTDLVDMGPNAFHKHTSTTEPLTVTVSVEVTACRRRLVARAAT